MKLIATGDLTQHGATRMLTQHMADCGFHRLISWLSRFCLRMQIFQLREHMSRSCWKGTFVFAESASTSPKGRGRKPASLGHPGQPIRSTSDVIVDTLAKCGRRAQAAAASGHFSGAFPMLADCPSCARTGRTVTAPVHAVPDRT